MRLRHGSLVLVVLLGATPTMAVARTPRLRVAPRTAVPGQVVELRGARVGAKGVRVTIGRKRARVVRRRTSQVRVIVPRLRPGARSIVLKARGQRLSGRLRIRRGLTGSVKPMPDRARARSAGIGAAGGVLAATGADGTRYELSVPAGALAAPAMITMTPLRRIRGLPLTRATGVQLGPDGLTFARAATLKITLKRAAARGSIAFTYAGGGRQLALDRATRSGATLTLPVEHFSGAGGGTITVAGFLRYVARLLIGRLTLTDVDQFLHELQVVESLFGDFCLTDATCAELLDRSADLLEAEAGRFTCGTRDPAQVLQDLRGALHVEGNLRLVGRPRAIREADELANERRCVTNSLVAAADPPARSDAVGVSSLASGLEPADRSSADIAHDGEVWNAEWAIFVAGIAAQQGFSNLQAQALGAFEAGLQTVLDDGKTRCDESFPEGSNLLKKGQKLAEATQTLVNEFADAIADCKPKIFATPAGAAVETGKQQTFTARSNDGDATFDWRASDGSIDASGRLTAPNAPGTITVTAASRQRPVLTGSVTVTVACPAGQVPFAGQCRTISVSIDPPSVALLPRATQQFSATVANTSDTRVTWTATCGSVNPAGLYTAPGGAGSCTVTAPSVADPSKSAGALVVVGGHVDLLGRDADLDVTSSVGCSMGASDFETAHDERPAGSDFSGPLHLELSTSATGSCGGTTGHTSQDTDLRAVAAGGTSWSMTTDFTGGTAVSDENLIASRSESSLSGSIEAIGQEATITCSGTIGTDGSVSVQLDDAVVTNRTGAGSFTGSLAVPADGESRSLVIVAKHGGAGSRSSSVACKFDRPSVVVPD